jgi:3-hydroxy-3-methylglutaryl CoA synthase
MKLELRAKVKEVNSKFEIQEQLERNYQLNVLEYNGALEREGQLQFEESERILRHLEELHLPVQNKVSSMDQEL